MTVSVKLSEIEFNTLYTFIMKKFLITSLVFLSLIFNIQAGFAHDIEHLNHDQHENDVACEEHDDERKNEAACEQCLLNYHLAKSTNLNSFLDVETNNYFHFDDSYFINSNIFYAFLAYQSQAP